MYFLLDANVTAGYYLRRSLKSTLAYDRISAIFDSVRSGGSAHFLYIPNFCIPEVFSVFMKYAFSYWNRQVKTKQKTILDKRVYHGIVRQFEADIHNGKFIYQYELSRYHILSTHLIAPIDHYYKIRRNKQVTPMGTFDHLVASMAVDLARIHGQDKVALLTSDRRLADIIARCRRPISLEMQKWLQLAIGEEVTGFKFSPDLFPMALNLASASSKAMLEVVGQWPLPFGPKTFDVYRWRS